MLKPNSAPALASAAAASVEVRHSLSLARRDSAASARVTRADLAAALKYIRRYACDGLTVRRLVQETQRVPQVAFTRYFKDATGRTPLQAIRCRQLDSASHLLATTELSLALIAGQCGFRSVSALHRAFKAAGGAVPRAFRLTQLAQKKQRLARGPARRNSPRVRKVDVLDGRV